jgi:uncharacterized protein
MSDRDHSTTQSTVTIVGASVRAAAYSALRAGLTPWCVDLFADADLRAVAETRRVPVANYPQDFLALLRQAPAGPVVYTGGLENYPNLIEAIAKDCTLWGNDGESLRRSRDPFFVCRLLDEAGLCSPRLAANKVDLEQTGPYVRKPFRSAGGAGILVARADEPLSPGYYLQQFISGPSHSAVFCAFADRSVLLGVTEQLVGEEWLNAKQFSYCGSIGPVDLPSSTRDALRQLGEVLRSGCSLRGLFGVDFILKDGQPWPVEVNPRYTASIEVLEHATGLRAIMYHRAAFAPEQPDGLNRPPAQLCFPTAAAAVYACVGKAIVFAPRRFVAPSSSASGQWPIHTDPLTLPDCADIPYARETIEEGWPILTVFAHGASREECRCHLRERAVRILLEV